MRLFAQVEEFVQGPGHHLSRGIESDPTTLDRFWDIKCVRVHEQVAPTVVPLGMRMKRISFLSATAERKE